MAKPAVFGVVGGGWRTEFFLRLATMAPEHFSVSGVVTRSAEKGAAIEAAWGVPTFRSSSELVRASSPEFVIPAVSWDAAPQAVKDLVALEIPVLVETPPAPDLDGLRDLWSAVGASGLVQVAEQYLLMPMHAARLALLREGVIGEVTSVQISSTHLYHATSMMRGMLDVGFAPATVSAQVFTAPLVDPLGKDGWTDDSKLHDAATTIATIDFGAGRTGLYDFTDNQWWNPLRARRIVIRGSRGEIVDDAVVRLVDARTPVSSVLTRRRLGVDLNLEGSDVEHISFDGRVVWRNAYLGSRFSEDDLAVTALLSQMALWCRGEGPAPYPLAEGCQDHLLGLAIGESARTGAPVTTSVEAWAR
ncbi:MAG TPA: Gfo/Idh/MocA family oxidoreductase [Acidothermaceae bacterium]|nr:Gfo/Idh/MocA family oxidoreductase [Acidothermaceae bacterium]